MSALASVILALVYLLAGAGILSAGRRRLRELDRRLDLGESFLLGAALSGIALHLPLASTGALSASAHAWVAALLVGLAIPGARALYLDRFVGASARSVEPPRLRGSFRTACVLFLLAAASLPLTTFDCRAIYALKAKVLAAEGTLAGEMFTDPELVHYHANYPLLLPLLEAQMILLRGGSSSDGAVLLTAFFVVAAASVLVRELRLRGEVLLPSVWGLVFLTTPLVAGTVDGGGLSGYADLPFAALVLAGTVALARWLDHGALRSPIDAALFLGAAALTKQEGLLWIAAAGSTTAALRPGSLRRLAPAALLLTAILAAGWRARLDLAISPYEENYGAMLHWGWLSRVGHRAWPIAQFVMKRLVDEGIWGMAGVGIVLTFLVARRGPVPTGVRFLRWTLAAVLAMVLATFLVTPNHLTWHLSTALSRLMLQAYPLGLLLLGEQWTAAGWTDELAGAVRGAWPEPAVAGDAPSEVRRAA